MKCEHAHTRIVTSRIEYGPFHWIAVEFCIDCKEKLERKNAYGN